MRLLRYISVVIAVLVTSISVVAQEKYALVDISTAYVRARPSHSGELVTQQLMGMPVKILSNEGEWSKVETIDGYTGYIIDNTLTPLTAQQYSVWKNSDRVVVTSHKEGVIAKCNGTQVSDIVPGAILQVVGRCDKDSTKLKVKLPDGRTGNIDERLVTGLKAWSAQQFDKDAIIAYGMDNLGAPYLWGGMSPKGMDCSGLTWTAYWLNGRLLQRDASQQAKMSGKITDWRKLKACDLAFFGNPNTGRITHVALLRDDNSNIVHASAGRVRLNSLDPEAPDHIPATFLWGISLSDMPPVADMPASKWLY